MLGTISSVVASMCICHAGLYMACKLWKGVRMGILKYIDTSNNKISGALGYVIKGKLK